jgi:hypothetical protein
LKVSHGVGGKSLVDRELLIVVAEGRVGTRRRGDCQRRKRDWEKGWCA